MKAMLATTGDDICDGDDGDVVVEVVAAVARVVVVLAPAGHQVAADGDGGGEEDTLVSVTVTTEWRGFGSALIARCIRLRHLTA